MTNTNRLPVWPFICIVGCMFILCLLAPRLWSAFYRPPQRVVAQEKTRKQRTGNLPATQSTPITEQGVWSAPTAFDGGEVAQSQPATVVASREPESAIELTEPANSPTRDLLLDLLEFEQPQVETDEGDAPELVDYGPAPPSPEHLNDLVQPPETAQVGPIAGNLTPSRQSTSASPLGQRAAPVETESHSNVATTEASRVTPEQRAGEPVRPSIEQPRPQIAKTPSPQVAPAETVWPYATSIERTAQALSQTPLAREWARELQVALHDLYGLRSLDSPEAMVSFRRLHRIAHDAWALSEDADDATIRTELQRAAYAISRRVEVWHQVYLIADRRNLSSGPANVDFDVLRNNLSAIELRLARTRNGGQWREYLLLDDLKRLAEYDGRATEQPGRLALRVIHRMESTRLDTEQRAYFKQPDYLALKNTLKQWATEPIDYVTLLRQIEQFEDSNTSSDARSLAESISALRWSPGADVNELGRRLDGRYRNANLRMSVSQWLMNRMLPAPNAVRENVVDQIQGADVRGQSSVDAQLSVNLVPDAERIRLDLTATGLVNSQTQSHRRPITFFDSSTAKYQARKSFAIETDRVLVWDSRADSASRVRNMGMESELDFLPVIGPMVRSIAERRRAETQTAAVTEVEQKLESRVQTRIDEQVRAELKRQQADFRTQVIEPLERLHLDPTPLDMSSTATHANVRFRLGKSNQLTAHTPRPEAPPESALSVQFHHSVVNNVLDSFKWQGRTMELSVLFSELAQRFNRPVVIPDDLPEDVMVTFAEGEPVRAIFEKDRIGLTIRIAMLAHRKNAWRDFAIHVFYVPRVDGLNLSLQRDGIVQIEGRLGFRDQIALRAIFSRVFSNSKPVKAFNADSLGDPRLADLTITHLVIDEGWMGAALNPMETTPQETPYTASRENTLAGPPLKVDRIVTPNEHAAAKNPEPQRIQVARPIHINERPVRR